VELVRGDMQSSQCYLVASGLTITCIPRLASIAQVSVITGSVQRINSSKFLDA